MCSDELKKTWEKFFDKIGVVYASNPPAVEFEDGEIYQPTFYLPVSNVYVEVKDLPPKEQVINIEDENDMSGSFIKRCFRFIKDDIQSNLYTDVFRSSVGIRTLVCVGTPFHAIFFRCAVVFSPMVAMGKSTKAYFEDAFDGLAPFLTCPSLVPVMCCGFDEGKVCTMFSYKEDVEMYPYVVPKDTVKMFWVDGEAEREDSDRVYKETCVQAKGFL